MREVARRAGLAPATAYTYFSSKEHLVAELFWRLVSGVPPYQISPRSRPAGRAAAALSSVADLIATEPQLARACTQSLLVDDPDVRRLRDQIGDEWSRRVAGAVGGEAPPEQISVLLWAWSGVLVAAAMGHLHYGDLRSHTEVAAEVILGTGS